MPTLLNKTIRLFLDSIGRREEYEFYLNKFTAFDTPVFALICPDAEGFEDTAQALNFDLDALQRLELHPAIVLAGEHAPSMRKILLTGDHPYDLHDLNDTTSADLAQADAFLRECAAARKTGILTMSHFDIEEALPRLIPALARRIHLLRPVGAMRHSDGTPIQYYFTNAPEEGLAPEDLSMASLCTTIHARYSGVHLSVCSPWQLLQELFTVRGAGTIVRRQSVIRRCTISSELDEERLLDLLQSAFGRKPVRDRIMASISCAYVEEDYRGAALLEEHPAGVYLAKFAVGTEARGEGLSSEIWDQVSRNHPAMFWRSRKENPFNHWYRRRAGGYHREGDWDIFWIGIEPNRIPEVIYECSRRGSDFEEV